MKILFIQTGGTIDKDYPKVVKAYHFEICEPAVGRILQKIKPAFEYDVISILKKDSMDLTDEDRQLILKTCLEASAKKILITHGTDTMVETARVLSEITDKAIILTGSARPERFANTDADVNVGTALGALNLAENGVYIAMNGRVYPWDKVQKDQSTGQFVASSLMQDSSAGL